MGKNNSNHFRVRLFISNYHGLEWFAIDNGLAHPDSHPYASRAHYRHRLKHVL